MEPAENTFRPWRAAHSHERMARPVARMANVVASVLLLRRRVALDTKAGADLHTARGPWREGGGVREWRGAPRPRRVRVGMLKRLAAFESDGGRTSK